MANLETMAPANILESKTNKIENRTGFDVPKSLEIWSIKFTVFSREGSGEKTALVLGKDYQDCEKYLVDYHHSRNMRISISQQEFKCNLHGISTKVWKKFDEWLNLRNQKVQKQSGDLR